MSFASISQSEQHFLQFPVTRENPSAESVEVRVRIDVEAQKLS
jgi:hypothetical protein